MYSCPNINFLTRQFWSLRVVYDGVSRIKFVQRYHSSPVHYGDLPRTRLRVTVVARIATTLWAGLYIIIMTRYKNRAINPYMVYTTEV